MKALADISLFESFSNSTWGSVHNAVSDSPRMGFADIGLFDNLMIYNAASLPVTMEGYQRLKEELSRLENEEMPKVRDQIATAREEGDLSENAEYHAAREKQGLIQAKINELKDRLSRAEFIDTSKIPHDEVRFGAKVTVTRLDTGEKKDYTLVGLGDDDPSSGRILSDCPLAKALLGAKEGEEVTFVTPAGKERKYHIDHISYGDEPKEGEDFGDENAPGTTEKVD